MGYSSPISDQLAIDLSLSTEELSIFFAILNVGASVGAIAGGWAMGRIGRTGFPFNRVPSLPRVLQLAALSYFVGNIVLALSVHAEHKMAAVFAGRVITGLGVGLVRLVVNR